MTAFGRGPQLINRSLSPKFNEESELPATNGKHLKLSEWLHCPASVGTMDDRFIFLPCLSGLVLLPEIVDTSDGYHMVNNNGLECQRLILPCINRLGKMEATSQN